MVLSHILYFSYFMVLSHILYFRYFMVLSHILDNNCSHFSITFCVGKRNSPSGQNGAKFAVSGIPIIRKFAIRANFIGNNEDPLIPTRGSVSPNLSCNTSSLRFAGNSKSLTPPQISCRHPCYLTLPLTVRTE